MTMTETIHTIARATASGASASKIFLYRFILWPPDLLGKQYGDRTRRLESLACIRVIVLTNGATRVCANPMSTTKFKQRIDRVFGAQAHDFSAEVTRALFVFEEITLQG